jgi:hypothetical protein
MLIELEGTVCGETLKAMLKASPWLLGINALAKKERGTGDHQPQKSEHGSSS